MFKRLTLFVMSLVVLGGTLCALMPVSQVMAVDVTSTGDKGGPCNNPDASNTPVICQDTTPTNSNPIFGPSGIITVAIKILSFVTGVLAIIFILVQGIRIVLSGGDAQSVSQARNGLIYALVGLFIAVLAQVIVAFVLNKVG